MKAPFFGWVALACLALTPACSEPEEVCLSGNCGPAEGGAGGESDAGAGGAAGEGGAGEGGMGGEGGMAAGGQGGGGPGGQGGSMMPVDPMPDRALFADGLAQMLNAECGGAGCHAEEHVIPADGEYGAYPQDIGFTDDEIDGMMAEVLEWVDFSGPLEQSPLLLWIRDEAERGHPFTSSFSDENYALLLAWMRDAITPPEPEPMGGMGGGEGGMGGDMPLPFCDGLPNRDPLERPDYYERFEERINGLLITECANGDCHAIPQNGGQLWLDSEFCSVQWNFNAVQAFINQQFPNQSPLLTQPLSDNHGGRQVFDGMDTEYVQLLNWVRLSMP